MNIDPYRNVDFDRTDEVAIGDLSPRLAACVEYWRSLGADGALPSWRDVDLTQIPSDVLPFVTVVDIDWSRGTVDGDAIVYRYWGTGHVRAKNIERTGRAISEHSSRAHVVTAEYLRVLDERRPIAFVKNIRIDEPWHAVVQTTVRLPLSNDGTCVDHVLSASEWADIA